MKTLFEIHDTQGAYDKQFRIATDEEILDAIKQATELDQWDKNTDSMKKRSRDEIIAKLESGREVKYAPAPNHYYTHDMKRIRIFREPAPAPELKKCDCGCSVPGGSVMNASMGSSCPDCYDRMSM